ncbi:MAG: PadR family transcriptional regulator [Thermoplasmata archaeon]|nr:PadR family transcriptional regulator [Thermoplasmata archaeon]
MDAGLTVALLAVLLCASMTGIGFRPGTTGAPSSPRVPLENVRSATAAVTTQWTPVAASPPQAPLPGAGYAMAYDPALSAVVSFGGGQSSGSVEGFTWEFARGVWTNATGSVGPAPSPRSGAAVVADAQVGGLLLYGGLASNGTFDTDTWSFSSGHWQDLTSLSGTPPSARFSPAMAYDSSDGEAVLFGGETSGAVELNDTWTYAHGNWTLLPTTGLTAPSPRHYATMADDPAEHGVLVFGGQGSGGTFGDTWEFAAGHWFNLTNSIPTAPPSRRAALMAYDSTNQSVLLFGGDSTIYGNALADTWRFQSGRWWNLTALTPTHPPARFATGLSDDPTDNGTVLFGGCTAVGCTSYLGDTWVWRDVPLAVSVAPPTVTGFVPLHASFIASVTGGFPPYGFSWKNGTGPLAPGTSSWNGTFAAPGNTSVAVYVSDRAGGNVSSAGLVAARVHGPPPPPLAASLNSSSVAGTAPVVVRLHATVTGGSPPYGLTWQNGSAAALVPGNAYWNGTYPQAGNFTITFSVRDATGNVTNAKATVQVSAKTGNGNGGHPSPSSGTAPLLPTWAWALLLLAVGAIASALVLLGLRRRRGPRTPSPPADGSGPNPGSAPSSPVDSGAGDANGSALPGGAAGAGLGGAAAATFAVETRTSENASPTLSHRLLLHLLSLGALRPSDIAPIGRTQEGIAAALGRPQGSFARVLQRLEESGLLIRELRHVQGKPRRVQVYALTDRGYQLARELRPSSAPLTAVPAGTIH